MGGKILASGAESGKPCPNGDCANCCRVSPWGTCSADKCNEQNKDLAFGKSDGSSCFAEGCKECCQERSIIVRATCQATFCRERGLEIKSGFRSGRSFCPDNGGCSACCEKPQSADEGRRNDENDSQP